MEMKKKLEKKSAELDRNEKRFHSLQNVRPAFMDEYELLLRAVRDSNKPKFLKEDIVLFGGIISDVFSDIPLYHYVMRCR